MAKLHLELDQLTVESFETADGSGNPGTVRANEGTQVFQCGEDSNLVSCGGSCHHTSCDDPATCYGCTNPSNDFTCRCTVFEPTCQPSGPAPDTCCQMTC